MPDDFTRYEAMQRSGACPEEIYRAASRNGLDDITRIRLIRVVCSLSLGEAKEVMLRAEGDASTLDEFQQGIAEAIERQPGQKARN
ncbi:MAG TPA: hypothetical protein VFI31_02005 [Pirellulales bacterium]|nr:hypothetical protein [Pirellulales bacterium]